MPAKINPRKKMAQSTLPIAPDSTVLYSTGTLRSRGTETECTRFAKCYSGYHPTVFVMVHMFIAATLLLIIMCPHKTVAYVAVIE